MPRLDRREAITLVGSGIVAIGFANRAAAATPADIQLNVYRKGSLIGTHAIQFSQAGATLKVTSQVDLRVKVAFITAFRYQQTANDEWENELLVRTRIQTNDNGKETLVQAEVRDGQLAVQGPLGSHTTQLGAMTEISFWNQAITQGLLLIDSKTAELIRDACRG